jgi:hypothetical protein
LIVTNFDGLVTAVGKSDVRVVVALPNLPVPETLESMQVSKPNPNPIESFPHIMPEGKKETEQDHAELSCGLRSGQIKVEKSHPAKEAW